jgi:DNA polymerase-3 subunit beta
LLLDTLKNMDDVPMTFTVDPATYAIEITSGDGKYQLAGQNAETYPTLPTLQDTVTLEMTASALVDIVNKTAFATAIDDTHQQMSGINFIFANDMMTAVATDAHKLVRYSRLDIKSDTPSSFIMPRKPITLVKNILSSKKDESTVMMEYNNTNVAFSFDNMYVVCRLIDGKYPNIEAAIPKENPNKLTIDRNSFLNTLRRVGLFASQSTHQVRLILTEHELTISAEDFEFFTNAQEKLPCQYEGEPMEIGFNAKFLIEMVNNIETENILIEMSHPSRAGILFPIYEDEEQRPDKILMLVMPVMLSN